MDNHRGPLSDGVRAQFNLHKQHIRSLISLGHVKHPQYNYTNPRYKNDAYTYLSVLIGRLR